MLIVYIHIPHLDLGCIHMEKSEPMWGHIPQSAKISSTPALNKAEKLGKHFQRNTVLGLTTVTYEYGAKFLEKCPILAHKKNFRGSKV